MTRLRFGCTLPLVKAFQKWDLYQKYRGRYERYRAWLS